MMNANYLHRQFEKEFEIFQLPIFIWFVYQELYIITADWKMIHMYKIFPSELIGIFMFEIFG